MNGDAGRDLKRIDGAIRLKMDTQQDQARRGKKTCKKGAGYTVAGRFGTWLALIRDELKQSRKEQAQRPHSPRLPPKQ